MHKNILHPFSHMCNRHFSSNCQIKGKIINHRFCSSRSFGLPIISSFRCEKMKSVCECFGVR
jgi:hypothetical protein